MTERQVGRQMQTIEPAWRVRRVTGLQKASNSPLHALYNNLHSLNNRFSNYSFALFYSRDGYFHSLRSEAIEEQPSSLDKNFQVDSNGVLAKVLLGLGGVAGGND